MLFHFFNKETIITDEYVKDPKSELLLYAKQSQAVKPTNLSTGISIPNSEINSIGKVEVCLHHKLADVENFGFIWAGQNTSPAYATTGLYLTSGKNGYSTMFNGSLAANCIILTSALEDDNTYIITSDFNTSNIVMKANKVTIVNNAKVIGSDINGSTTAKGTETLTADIGILSGRTNSAYVYSSKHKIFWIKFYDKQGALMHEFNFSEGAGSQTFDVITGNAYDISNINPSLFWNYKQDFNHYNFRHGFTLYQKSGSPDIRIPNKKDGSEIILPAPPAGYTRIANYKECRQTFNQCENVFVLDNVNVETITISGALNPSGYNGDYIQNGTWAGNPKYDKIDDPTKNIWKSGTPYDVYGWAIGDISSQGYWYEYPNGDGDDSTPFPWDVVSFSPFLFVGATGTVNVTLNESSPLYLADVDFVLFTESTGVAKEITIQDIYSEIVDLTHDRGHLYINEDSDANFMLYKTDKGVDTPADLKIWAYVEK